MTLKITIAAGLVSPGVAAALHSAPPAGRPPLPAPPRSARASAAAAPAKYRGWLNRNCVPCHNKKSPLPADHPVSLEANLDDLLANADTWERVLKKLSVRAMPPPGVPH